MIKIQDEPKVPTQVTTRASVKTSVPEARSSDTYAGNSIGGLKLLGTAMFALAAMGGASARELQTPWQGNTRLRPTSRRSAGGVQGLGALSVNATTHRGLRSVFASAPVTAAPGPVVAPAPVSVPVPGPASVPAHAAQNDATPSNWLSPTTAPHGSEAPASEG